MFVTTMAWAACALLCGAVAGCSLILDNETTQCQVDADCERFGGHPYCQKGVCSELGPDNCVADEPRTQSDYLNACSTSRCVPFDNCERLGLCTSDQPLPPTVDPTTLAIPALLNQVPMPTAACSDNISPTNVIYMFGSADFAPLLKAAQKALSVHSPPYRAVFQNASSCAGVGSIFNDTNMKDPPDPSKGGWAFYFDDTGQQVNCLIEAPYNPSSLGTPVDIGVSDLYAKTCNPAFVPGTAVAEYTGPVVPFVLSVPATSQEQSISAAAAHMIFGLGGKAPVGSGLKDAMPWDDFTAYSIRNAGAGSTVLTARLVDVPPAKFWGVDRLSTDNLRDSLLTSTAKDKAIGILSIDFNDKNRDNLRALYLQVEGQLCGYQPDSSPTTYDKVNVRDGHYPLWGYVHFFTPRIAGTPSPAASAMVLQFGVPRLEQQLVDDIIAASLVPQCAMKVARTDEVGGFVPQIGFQCGCYFDFKTKGRTSCTTCASSEECPSDHPACNYGYCEAN